MTSRNDDTLLLKEDFTAAELARLTLPGLPTSKRRVNARATREGWAFILRAQRGGGRAFPLGSLPESVRAEILRRRVAKGHAASVSAQVGKGLYCGCDGFYVASRASVPERAEMWRRLRDQGVPIVSSWIDEAGDGETACLVDLWRRIDAEIASCSALILYVEMDDFPLKGALIEAGMAFAQGKRVYVVAPGVVLEPHSLRPLGSWAMHPLVSFHHSINQVLHHHSETTGKKPRHAIGKEQKPC